MFLFVEMSELRVILTRSMILLHYNKMSRDMFVNYMRLTQYNSCIKKNWKVDSNAFVVY